MYFNQLLGECLSYLLFNEPVFESYVKKKLTEKFSTLYSLTEKLEALYQMEKSIKVLQERTTALAFFKHPVLQK